jgi:hypothetical protein
MAIAHTAVSVFESIPVRNQNAILRSRLAGVYANFKTVDWPLGWLIYEDVPVVGHIPGVYTCAGLREGDFLELRAGGEVFMPRSVAP